MGVAGDPRRRHPLAVSMGDPAGIGPEITLRAWLERNERGLDPFVVYADRDVLGERARHLGLAVPLTTVQTPGEASDAFRRGLPVLHLSLIHI